MQRFLFSLLLFFGIATKSFAQNIRITDAEGMPLSGIEVSNGTLTITDNDGKAALPAKTFPVTVEVSAVGFESVKQQIRNDELTTIILNRRTASLQEMVVTGIPRATKLQNALSQYRVITSAESRAQGSINLAEALATRLNINIGSDQLLGATTTIQGMKGNKVKILIDGLPVNGRENGNIDLSQLNLNNVDRIEVVQGPMSVVYGSDALGGVINLITRKTAKPWEASAGFNYETVGKYNADFNLSRKWNKHQLLVGGGRNYFNGWKDIDSTKDTYTPHRRLLWKPKEQYLANATYNYTAKSGFKLQLASDFMREKITNLGAAVVNSFGGYAVDEYYRTNRLNNRLILEKKSGKNGRWESRNSYAIYHRTRESVSKNLVTLDEQQTPILADQDTSRYDDITLRSNYSNILNKLKYDAGYDISLQRGYSGKIPEGAKNINDYALYQNLSYALLKEKLTLQGSLRESYNTQYSVPLIYSLQALYTPLEKLQIRASYAKGFRSPTLKEQYLDFIDQNHKIFGNAELKPETGNHIQASASYQLYQKKSDYVQLIITGFYNDITNQISLSNLHPDDPNNIEYKYYNSTHIQNAIANVQLEQQWNNLNLVLEYGLVHTYGQIGYNAYNTGEYIARANYYWKPGRITLNAFYKLTGATDFVQEDIDGSTNYKGKQNAYQRLDGSASRKFFNRKLEVIAGVKNIFNVQQTSGTFTTASSGGAQAHGTDGIANFLPRSFFTTVRVNLN